jgi:hypothetical protein
MALALDERDLAMRSRARELAVRAIKRREAWISRLGTPPADPASREMWIAAVSTVAAYRNRWSISNDHRPLGSEGAVKSMEVVGQRKRAQAAIQRALILSESGVVSGGPQPTAARVEPSPDRSESITISF